jgi:molybdopterin-guanine dinucleotide biosynthesis protein A
MTKKNLYGLILNGGRSSRMGFDKGNLTFHGTSQREFLYNLLEKYCDEVFISVKEAPDSTELKILQDKFEIESPLNGILTALEFNPATAWLTVPVDMPGIDEQIISFLLQHRDYRAVATCFLDADGKKPEPLVTIWEPSSLPLMRSFYQQNKISPREFLMNIHCRKLIAPNGKFYRNINTPQELKEFGDELDQRE